MSKAEIATNVLRVLGFDVVKDDKRYMVSKNGQYYGYVTSEVALMQLAKDQVMHHLKR